MTQSLDRIGSVVVYKSANAANNAMLVDRIGQAAAYKSALAINNAMLVDRIGLTAVYRGPTPAIGFASGTSGSTRALSDTLLYQKPTSDAATGTWLNQAGAAVLYTALSKPAGVDDSTYIVAAANTTDTARVKLEAPFFEVGDEAYVDYRIGKNFPNAPQNVDVTVKLYQGVTLIATWTNTAIAGNLTTITQTLTAPQLAAITDYSDLYLEFVSTPK